MACARCGENRRHDDTFLCSDCLDSPNRHVEQRTAELAYPGDHREQRRLLIEAYDWRGWNRRLKTHA